MATLFPFLSPKAQVRVMSSANWAKVTGGKCLAPVISKLEATAYPVLLFPSKTKLLPSVYMISSGLVRKFSDNPSWVLSSGPRFLGKSERGERALGGKQDSGWVKNLTKGYSEAWIFHQHYLIFENSLIRYP